MDVNVFSAKIVLLVLYLIFQFAVESRVLRSRQANEKRISKRLQCMGGGNVKIFVFL